MIFTLFSSLLGLKEVGESCLSAESLRVERRWDREKVWCSGFWALVDRGKKVAPTAWILCILLVLTKIRGCEW